MSKAILVTGATGKQGGALISALLDAPDAGSYRLIALTRKPTSAAAKMLADQGVDLIQGDLNDVPGVFQTAQEVAGGRIWGVFAVLVSDTINLLRTMPDGRTGRPWRWSLGCDRGSAGKGPG